MQDKKFEEFQKKLDQHYRNEVVLQISRMDLTKAPELAEKIMDSKWSEGDIWDAMVNLWRMLKEAKPEERNELARRYAVTMTELEKVMGYYNSFVMHETDLIGPGTE